MSPTDLQEAVRKKPPVVGVAAHPESFLFQRRIRIDSNQTHEVDPIRVILTGSNRQKPACRRLS